MHLYTCLSSKRSIVRDGIWKLSKTDANNKMFQYLLRPVDMYNLSDARMKTKWVIRSVILHIYNIKTIMRRLYQA